MHDGGAEAVRVPRPNGVRSMWVRSQASRAALSFNAIELTSDMSEEKKAKIVTAYVGFTEDGEGYVLNFSCSDQSMAIWFHDEIGMHGRCLTDWPLRYLTVPPSGLYELRLSYWSDGEEDGGWDVVGEAEELYTIHDPDEDLSGAVDRLDR